MRIRRVRCNNHSKAFEVAAGRKNLAIPYCKADPPPSVADPVTSVFVDRELGSEAFTYILRSGREGTIHIEQVLEYNQDPTYLRDALLYRLTIEAQKRIKRSRLSKREIIRRLATSPAQIYRLLDQTNYRKSIDQVLSLLHVLDCDVKLLVRERRAA